MRDTWPVNAQSKHESDVPAHIAASIEITPGQAVGSEELTSLFPAGTHVYIADIGNADPAAMVAAARRLKMLGYEPVPHLAARRIATEDELERRIAAYTQDAGVADILVIGGGLSRPAGIFDSTLAVLETGVLERYGIERIGIAGHPEGTPDFSDVVAVEILRMKQAFGERTGANVRIVTQFGFDPQKAIGWAEGLAAQGIDLPVHLGVAGPARLTTLIRYAAMCGVGNSIDFLKRQARSLTGLATNQSPEIVVGPIEDHWRNQPAPAIRQIHVFPFGGIAKASEWLAARGSWELR